LSIFCNILSQISFVIIRLIWWLISVISYLRPSKVEGEGSINIHVSSPSTFEAREHGLAEISHPIHFLALLQATDSVTIKALHISLYFTHLK
jgi:hypothetical protein